VITPSKVYDQLIENMQDWPVAKLSSRRAAFVKELTAETTDHFRNKSAEELKEVLATTIFNERTRIKEEPWKVDPPKEEAYWNKVRNKVFDLDQSLEEQNVKDIYLKQINEIIASYSEEIVGSFKEESFRFARKFLRFFYSMRQLIKGSKDS